MNQEKVEDEVKRLCGLIQRGLFYDAKIMFDKNPELISVKDDNGVEFDIKDDSGWTPIMLSSSVGDQLLVRKLIGLGADLNAQNNFGSTCLHLAASKGHLEVCKSLLAAGASIEIRDTMLGTPLHRAAGVGKNEIIALLLDSGATIDPKDKNGDTPLKVAACELLTDTVILLLERGSNPLLLNKEGKCAADYIKKNDIPQSIQKVMLERFKDYTP